MNQGSPIPNPIRTPVRQNVYPAVGNVEMNKRIGIFDFFQNLPHPWIFWCFMSCIVVTSATWGQSLRQASIVMNWTSLKLHLGVQYWLRGFSTEEKHSFWKCRSTWPLENRELCIVLQSISYWHFQVTNVFGFLTRFTMRFCELLFTDYKLLS